MCGRYSLALRPSQILQMLQDDGIPIDEAPADEGPGSPRQTYNFAPGYHGIVFRAQGGHRSPVCEDHADQPAGDTKELSPVTYKLQSMKWGLIPFWTKRNPPYSDIIKCINCRDDSLRQNGGMWASMKKTKRCIVVAQGFFEWLKTGPKDKLPHYIKRRDGHLMCFAGLWDSVQFEGWYFTAENVQEGH